MSELTELASQVRVCQRCILSKSRKNAVPGEGPGFHEDQQGRPFVGAAGHFLDELLALAGLKREEVYITNIVKCRPPGNRDPHPDEIEACSIYLNRQLELISPRVVVTLGRHSMERFIPGAKISQIHGLPRKIGGRMVVPMYHPAAGLHQPKWKSVIEADFRKLPDILKSAGPGEGDDPSPPASQQLSLF